MSKTLLEKIVYEIAGFSFFIRNMKASRGLSPMNESTYEGYQITGLTKNRLPEIDQLHRQVRKGRRLNFWRRLFLRYHGEQICCVAINKEDKLVGFNFFYFKEDENDKGIIHDAFIGISRDDRSKGLATALQSYAVAHFSTQGLVGISGNVEKANQPSVKMFKRVGFELKDDPQDVHNYNVFYGYPNIEK